MFKLKFKTENREMKQENKLKSSFLDVLYDPETNENVIQIFSFFLHFLLKSHCMLYKAPRWKPR